jgi:hypothetical protein
VKGTHLSGNDGRSKRSFASNKSVSFPPHKNGLGSENWESILHNAFDKKKELMGF